MHSLVTAVSFAFGPLIAFIRADMMNTLLTVSLLTLFVFAEKSSAMGTCGDYLDNSKAMSINDRYYDFNGSRDKGAKGKLSLSDKSNRVFLRALLSDTLVPLFKEISIIQHVDRTQVADWMFKYEDLTTYQMAFKILSSTKYVNLSFKDIENIFDRTFKYKMSFSGFWSKREAEEFEVGLDLNQAYFMRTFVSSIYFIVGQLNEPKMLSLFEHTFNDGNALLDQYTFTQSDFAYMMDFVFVSYLHSIALLNVRPKNSRYESMTDSEWLKQLLLPQAGERMSLVEKLSLILRPAVSGTVGLNFAALDEPLLIKDDKLVFGHGIRELVKRSNAQWQLATPLSNETGLGCPAAYCSSGKGPSSLAMFNEVLVSVFTHVSEIGINPQNLYDPNLEDQYLRGSKLVESLRFK